MSSLRVVHLVTYDNGGAAGAAIRLSNALLKIGVDSKVVVFEKKTKESNVFQYTDNNFVFYLNKILRKINYYIVFRLNKKVVNQFTCDLFGCNVIQNKIIKNADVIHLHWVHSGMISNRSLKKIAILNKKVIWTLHDMASFTGGCYYSGNCNKYQKECIECPMFSENITLPYKAQKKRRNILQKLNCVAVGCSKWITDCALSSAIFKNKKVICIPNCIDTQIYRKKSNVDYLRKKYGIPLNKKIVLFGAYCSTSDTRKGYKYIQFLCNHLVNNNDIQIVVFGNENQEKNDKIIYLGKIEGSENMAEVYNLADVFVAPSKQENLANTVMESLACGTPVVAFNIGGMPDMIEHQYNGYLAKPYEACDLMNGVIYCIKNYKELSQNAIYYVEENFDELTVAQKYMDVYLEV